MNILRHKSWHVRNRNNITRVKKDEEKALQEEKEKQRRIDLADSQTRLQLLRQRTTAHKTTDDQSSGVYLDVFEDFNDKITTKNKDHDKEAKDEKEKFEKKTGILQYLVDKDTESDNNWYLDSHEKRMKLSDDQKQESDPQKVFKDNKFKKFNDPLEDMKRYLEAMKPKTDQKSSHKSNITSKESVKTVAISEKTISKSKSKKSKKHKKHKKKKRKRNSSESSNDNEVTKVSKTIEQLRAERIQRERVERERTRALLYGKDETKDSVIMDDRLRTYNSQFNPEIARQNHNDQ